MKSTAVPSNIRRVALALAHRYDPTTAENDIDLRNAAHADLPPVMRLLHIIQTETDDGEVLHEAVLYYGSSMVQIAWLSELDVPGLVMGDLVTLVTGEAVCQFDRGVYLVEAVRARPTPNASVPIFATIPPEWVGNAAILARAQQLWSRLEREDALWVNEMLWHSEVLRWYLQDKVPAKGAPRSRFERAVDEASRAAHYHSDDNISVHVATALVQSVEARGGHHG